MASNPYISFYNRTNEQNLMENLSVESVKQFAHDIYYLPRHIDVDDKILNEPVLQTIKHALDIEVYVKNWDDFQGEGQLLSKFGLEIRDQMTLIMTKKSFKNFVGPITNKERPWEGDMLYIPMLKSTYQIKYVSSSNAAFYILGKNYAWEISCELMEFSNEQFDTGVPEIDELNPPFENYNDPDYDLEDYDRTAQNKEIQDESDQIIDWTETSPFGEV